MMTSASRRAGDDVSRLERKPCINVTHVDGAAGGLSPRRELTRGFRGRAIKRRNAASQVLPQAVVKRCLQSCLEAAVPRTARPLGICRATVRSCRAAANAQRSASIPVATMIRTGPCRLIGVRVTDRRVADREKPVLPHQPRYAQRLGDQDSRRRLCRGPP